MEDKMEKEMGDNRIYIDTYDTNSQTFESNHAFFPDNIGPTEFTPTHIVFTSETGFTLDDLKPVTFLGKSVRITLSFKFHNDLERYISLQPGYYSNQNEFVAHLNSKLSGYRIRFRLGNQGKLTLEKCPIGISLVLQNGLDRILGFNTTRIEKAGVQASDKIILRRGLANIYLYSSIVRDTLIGDDFFPIIR